MTDTTHGAGQELGDPADAAGLMDMILGVVKVQVLHAVAALRIADHLADGARTAEEVAEREGSHPRATFRLMRAAASLGVLSYEGDRRFGLTGRGHLLREGVPGSLRAFALVQAGHAQWLTMGLFPEAVRQGASQATKALGSDMFAYYRRPENAGEAALFAESMANLSGLVVAGAVAAADTAGVSTVVDVGGADGQLLKTVLHDWDDEQAMAILRNCRSAAPDGGRALVVETVIGDIGKPDFATISDMGMLCVTGGMERDLEEFDALFAASGWRRGKTYPVGGGYFGLQLDAV